MKQLLTLFLCLCLALAGCAQGGAAPQPSKPDEAPVPAPVTAEGFERLALALAELPEIPEQPDEAALWDALDGKSPEEQDRLWNEFNERQDAYRTALNALRGDGADAALTDAFLAYTLRTARQLAADGAEGNVVWSPANLYLALCMLAETTGGESRAQLLNLLGLASVEQARSAANTLWRSLYNDGDGGKTLLANSLWLNEQYECKAEALDTLAKDYFASAFRAPMGDKATDAAIAAWINENTNHLLEDAANALETTPDTLLMLISTLYFKGTWSSQFDEFNTHEDVFTNHRGEEQTVDFMHRSAKGTYYRGDGFTVAALPFRDGTSMWFLLPDEGVETDAAALLEQWDGLAGDAVSPAGLGLESGYGEIQWSVPKFDVDSDLDLIPALQALGVTDIFTGDADFSPLTDLDALVSAVEHAARVKVDEEGCEAAAFTAVTVNVTSAMPEQLPVIEMNLNRPFGFLITGTDGMPLFMGLVNTMA